MASNKFIITISILLPLAFIWAATTTTLAHDEVATRPRYDRTALVVVEGKVYCQRCKYYGGPWSLSGAEPIPRARVRVICKGNKRRLSYYNTFKTDYDGYFYAELKDYKMSNSILDHPLHACMVRLVSSPLATCNEMTNVNGGIKGAPLRFENKVIYERGYETVVYAAGPLAFRPNDCYPENTSTMKQNTTTPYS